MRRVYFYFLFLFFYFELKAESGIRSRSASSSNGESFPKICLNMIVKDEKDVIVRCLDTVIPFIDYWVIVDTGSTDGTQKIITEHLKKIPGKLFERPWKNWGETRTEALLLAQEEGAGDYLLFMDADDILKVDSIEELLSLDGDLYYLWRGSKDFSYRKPQLVKKDLPWKWVGVTHEYLACDIPFSAKTLENIKYLTLDGGAGSKDPKAKFLKNIQLLEEGLKKEPKNDRYAFYLAESYRDAGEKGKALEWYQNRIKIGGWDEETFWAMFQSAILLRDLGLPSSVVIEGLLAAHRFRPHRPEPIYYLAEIYMGNGEYEKAYEHLKTRTLSLQSGEKDSLFNMDWIEKYGLLFKLSVCAYYVGHFEESLKACDQLLEIESLPENWREQVKSNRTFPAARLCRP